MAITQDLASALREYADLVEEHAIVAQNMSDLRERLSSLWPRPSADSAGVNYTVRRDDTRLHYYRIIDNNQAIWLRLGDDGGEGKYVLWHWGKALWGTSATYTRSYWDVCTMPGVESEGWVTSSHLPGAVPTGATTKLVTE